MKAMSLPVAEVHSLLRSGKVLDAWALAQATGIRLDQWEKGEPLFVAATLAQALGAPRLRQALDWLNWRNDRKHPKWYFQALFGRLRHTPGSDLIPEIESFLADRPLIDASYRADLMAFSGWVHSGHREFTPAFDCINEALRLQPQEPWIHVKHAVILEAADRYEEALEAAREAVRLRPYYHASVLQCADTLVHLGRDNEAIDMLLDADKNTQNAAFAMRLQALYSEREDHHRALWCLEQVEARSPLMDDNLRKWLAGRRADFHFMAGDIDACLEWCDRKGEGFQERMARKLRRPGVYEKKRVRLDVPFVRQHRMTCAPATLSAIASYWGRPHDHLQIADAICHEGTPWHKERRWAEDHGFVAREFRVTEDALQTLIDRGVPFTLTTEATTSAHLQACIGYDDRTGVILLRDPTERHFGEMFVSALIKAHPISGPRGMVMIPREEQHRLEGIHLPDEAAYDAYHQLLLAVDGHDRWLIETAISMLRAVAPGNPLTLRGEEQVAHWKEDRPGQLLAADELLRIAPEHQPTLLRKAYALRNLGRWQDLRGFLEEQVVKCDADPVFISELGELLMEDARLLPHAERYLKKAVRLRRSEARTYESLARLRSKQLRHVESIRLRRISSSLAVNFEPYAKGCFDACRAAGRTDSGIAFLTERVERFGQKAGGPWITLAGAVHEVRSNHEASDILIRAIAARPDEGELQLRAGAMMIGWGGDFQARGLEWMEGSRGRVPETTWLLETANTAAFLGDRAKAIRCWRSLIHLQPMAIEAWRGLARMIAEEDGEEAAVRLLDEATSRQPRLVQLWCLKAEWLAGSIRGPLESLGQALKLDPNHIWALRERAIRLMEAGDADAAEADAREAISLDPWAAESRGILGSMLEKQGRKIEAIECMREAIRLQVDYTFAATSLVALSKDRDEELESIRFIESEMRRQVSNGEILLTYQRLAWSHLDPPVLLKQLQDFCMDRPDLWQTWSARIEQALRMRLDGEALQAASILSESFPLMPRAWLELARVHQAAGRHEDERVATAKAVELSPGWDEAARAHAHVLEILGHPDEAATVLKRACQLDPLNGPNHGCLADVLRRNHRKAEALSSLRDALKSCPHYSWGWQTAAQWAVEDGLKDEIAMDLRKTGELHGHNRHWWPTAASAWDALGERDEALAATRKGLGINPTDSGLRDQLAYLLWAGGGYDEALAACGPVEGEENPPVNIQGRRAWLLMHSGHPLKGIEEMKELIRREPNYAWAMGELAAWHDHREEWRELRDHCKQWLRVSPMETRVLGYLGRAERALKNHLAAKEAFARAHALDPEYVFASRQLLDLQMIDGELEAASVTLSQLEHYSNNPYVVCDGIELELKRSDTESALKRADALLGNPAAVEDVFACAAKLFIDYGKESAWKSWLSRRLEAGSVEAPGALVAFLRTLPLEKLLKTARKRIAREAPGSDARAAAWVYSIQQLKRQPEQYAKTVRRLSNDKPSELFTNGRIWNAMGEALLTIGAPKESVRWLGNWRERIEDVNAATLVNLSAAHDTCPGDEANHWLEAGRIRAEAIKRFPDSGESQALRAGHALHLAADGRIEEAGNILADFEIGQTWDYYQALGRCAQAIVAAANADEKEARARLSLALDHLCRFNDLGTVRLRERTERVVARHIPWTKGKVKNLRKEWNLPVKGKKPHGMISKDNNFPIWPFCVVAYFLIKACSAMAQQ